MLNVFVNEQLIAQLFDSQPDGVAWYIPKFDPVNECVVDFELAYCNRVGAEIIGATPEQVMSRSLLSIPFMDASFKSLVFQQCLRVWQTGVSLEFTYSSNKSSRHFNIQRSKVQNGILSIIRDRTKEVQYEQERREQEKKYQQIIDTSTDGLLLLECVRNEAGAIDDFRIAYCNKAGYETGQLPADAVGKKVREVFPHLTDLSQHKQVVETGEPIRFETTFLTPDGREYGWFIVSLTKLGDGVVSRFTDITQRKQNEQQIIGQKALLDSILKNSSNGISVTEAIRNNQGRVVDARTIMANDAAIKLIGLPKKIYLSKTAVELDPNLADSEYYRQYLKTLETGEPSVFQYYLELTKRWLELTISRMDADHVIHIFTDVTSVKEAQLKLEETVKELKRSNKSLEEFAFAASHDLQEPLRKIHFFSSRLRQGLESSLNPEAIQMFERMELATVRMRNLIDDLLSYSQMNMEADMSAQVDLNAVVQHVLQDLEAASNEANARISVENLPVVRGNELQLRQLFQNLISNALKYRKEGVQPQIELRSHVLTGQDAGFASVPEERKGNYHLIEVSDNGIGFEQKNAERIFQVFQRLHGRSEYSGTGVGLAIAQRAVMNHKGFVAAKGEPGKGATFSILLPV